LQDAEESLHPSFRLRAARRDRRDPQLFEQPAELGRLSFARQLLCDGHLPLRVHAEDAVPVMVKRHWSSMRRDDHPHEQEIPLGILFRAEEHGEQFPGRVVNRRKEGEPWPSPFQPIVRTGINLDERSGLPAPLPSAAMRGGAPLAWTADPCASKHPAHTRAGEDDPFPIAQLLGQVLLIEPEILPRRQGDDLLPYPLAHGMCGLPASIAMRQRGHSFPPESGQQSLRLSRGERQPLRRSRHGQCPAHDLREDDDPPLFLLVQCHVLHGVTFSLNSYQVSES